jgi:predicted nucleotidyltransferase
MTLDRMLEELARRGIRFVVVGGVAALAHGSAYLTNDLDVCYDAAEENVLKLLELLQGWEAYPRGWEPGLPWIFDLKTFRTTPLLTLRTREGDIDLLDRVEGIGGFEACLAASEPLQLGDQLVRVLSLDALIDAKRAAGRRKDLERLVELEALRELKNG